MKQEKEFTATDLQNGVIGHHDFYAQFVTHALLDYVERTIGIKKILASKVKHLNDIPLARWDELHCVRNLINSAQWKRLYNTTYSAKDKDHFIWSPSSQVCLAKTAARMLRKLHGEPVVDQEFKIEYYDLETNTRGSFNVFESGYIDDIFTKYTADHSRPLTLERNGKPLLVRTVDVDLVN